MTRLTGLIRRLRALHGLPPRPPVRDPYLLLLWEQVGYLAADRERLAAYRLLVKSVGTTPEAILDAPPGALEKITRKGGGIAVGDRAERLRIVARRVRDTWNGKLRPVLRRPFQEARKELTRYPAIGEPGAERILLLAGAYPVLGLDSNAMRVLLRLGYGRESANYARTYRVVQAAAERELPETIPARQQAFLLLRYHGQTLCRRSAPRCPACPLRPDCPTGRVDFTGFGGAR